MPVLVVLLSGIPGSGKSTLARNLVQTINSLAGGVECAQWLSFDEIGRNVEWTSSSFHRIRGRALAALSESLAHNNSQEQYSDNSSLFGCFRRVLVVDDIMHLRSMRREVFVCVRDASCALFTVFVETSLSVARARNANREGETRVTEEAMDRISSAYQGPNPALIFDRHHLRCSLDSFDNVDSVVLDIITQIGALNSQLALRPLPGIDSHPQNNIRTGLTKSVDEKLRKIIQVLVPALQPVANGFPIGKLASEVKAFVLSHAKLAFTEMYESETDFADSFVELFVLTLRARLEEHCSSVELIHQLGIVLSRIGFGI